MGNNQAATDPTSVFLDRVRQPPSFLKNTSDILLGVLLLRRYRRPILRHCALSAAPGATYLTSSLPLTQAEHRLLSLVLIHCLVWLRRFGPSSTESPTFSPLRISSKPLPATESC